MGAVLKRNESGVVVFCSCWFAFDCFLSGVSNSRSGDGVCGDDAVGTRDGLMEGDHRYSGSCNGFKFLNMISVLLFNGRFKQYGLALHHLLMW